MKKTLVALTVGLGLSVHAMAFAQDAPELPSISLYHSTDCQLPEGWSDSLSAAGFDVYDVATEEIAQVQDDFGVPERYHNCFMGQVGDYFLSGAVPASLVKQLLSGYQDVRGMAVTHDGEISLIGAR